MQLLGSYDDNSGNDAFRNGDPNALNMLLWQMLLQLTTSDIASHCKKEEKLPYSAFFQSVIDPLCDWPSPAAKTEDHLRNFWLALMGYDAPEEEFLAWEKFATTSSLAEKPASDALPALFFLVV